MKKLFCFILAFVLTFGAVAGAFGIPVAAADGGEGSFHITSHSDGDTVNGNKDVAIKWSKVDGADHYWLTIKDTVTGDKPINQQVNGRTFTVDAGDVFVVDGRIYKVYVAAMDAQGQVLNRSSEWHAIYLEATYKTGGSLVYATPNLTSPEVEGKYLSARSCYYGTYDAEIDPTEDFVIRWENTYSGKYSVSVAVLLGAPDYGSTSEAKALTLEAKKLQTSRKYTVNKEILSEFQGRWLKLAVQGVDTDDNYSLLGMYYFKIASTSQPDPEPTPNPEPNDTIFVGGVDTGYADGSYFTKDGASCSCHNNGICLEDESRCNCIRYIKYKGKMVDLLAVQCFGWSRYLQLLAFGEHDGDSEHFQKTYTNWAATASGLKDALLGCAPGTHIRTSSSKKGYAHSVSILSTTSSGVTITDCNHTDQCQISVRSYTYAEFAEFLNKKYGGVDYISVYSKASSERPDDQPVYGGQLDITLGSKNHITGTPGQVIELDLVLNTPLAFLQGTVVSELEYTIKSTLIMCFNEGSNGNVMWYNALAQNVSGKAATIQVQIPEDAEVGQVFSFQFKVTDAFTAEEKQLGNVTLELQIEIKDSVLPGDVNLDSLVDARDLLSMIRYLLDDSSKINLKAADLDCSGRVNAIDLLRLISLLLS